ncbi:MAG: TetR/AcrR family transcriptional regulator, partial [Anaerolineae bacterium]|nr:TetR/AcrR family transcriptional regulator [Anaerolineae bacterium]
MNEDAKPPSRRERQKAERRSRIFRAAVEIFAEKGYRSTTMKEIAEAADVGEGTIYSYFSSKDELLMAIIEQVVALQQRQTTAQTSLKYDYQETLIEGIKNRMRRLGEMHTMYLAVLPEILNTPALRERFYHEAVRPALDIGEQHLRARIEKGDVPPLDVALTVRMVNSMSIGLSVLMILGDEAIHTAFHEPERLAQAAV